MFNGDSEYGVSLGHNSLQPIVCLFPPYQSLQPYYARSQCNLEYEIIHKISTNTIWIITMPKRTFCLAILAISIMVLSKSKTQRHNIPISSIPVSATIFCIFSMQSRARDNPQKSQQTQFASLQYLEKLQESIQQYLYYS
jgi:hypothetical protein